MSDAALAIDEAVRDYFHRREDAFWKWSDDGEALEWKDGTTIVFRQELGLILQRSAHQQIPPLEEVLLLLAACNSNWDAVHAMENSFDPTGVDRHSILAAPMRAAVECYPKLNAINEFFVERKATTEAKAVIVEMVSENFPKAIRPPVSEQIARALCEPIFREELRSVTELRGRKPSAFRTLRWLKDAVKAVSHEAIENRMRTGLEELISLESDTVELLVPPEPESLSPRQLLDLLDDDEEHAGLARLTRHLMAIMHLPQAILEHEELPLGGVSDITNRGPIDRLLLSELAHDTDVLMTRIALNEAMYYRREKPPSTPTRHRLIVQDTGMRMWGLPRLFATAAAISLAINKQERETVEAFRAVGAELEAFPMDGRDALLEHLACLTPHLDLSRSLEAVGRRLWETPGDLVLITSPEALADREFQRQMNGLAVEGLYLLSVDRNGTLQFLQQTARGQRVLKEPKLDLEELLSPKRRQAHPLLDESREPNVPAICHVVPFPLRLSHQVNSDASITLASDDYEVFRILAISHDRRLMLWDEKSVGGMQLTDQLPGAKRLRWWHWDRKLDVCWLLLGEFSLRSLEWVRVDFESYEVKTRTLELASDQTHDVFRTSHNIVLCRDGRHVREFSMTNGQFVVESTVSGEYVHRTGRFFRNRTGHVTTVYSGHGRNPVFNKMSDTTTGSWGDIVGITDCEDLSCPVAVLRNGRVIAFNGKEESGEKLHEIEPTDHAHFSQDGNVIAIRHNPNWQNSWKTYTLPNFDASWVSGRDPFEAIQQQKIDQFIKRRALRVTLQAMWATRDYSIAIAAKGKVLVLELDRSRDQLCFKATTDYEFASERKVFQQATAPEGVGYNFHKVELDAGGWAMLDSRGMLHLRGRSPALTEVTLVLHDTHVSGWTSKNQYFGAPYFYGGKTATSSTTVFEDVIQRIVRSWS